MEFDIDFGSFDFQKKFYSKYTVIKDKQYEDERDKERFLKIQVNLDQNTNVLITAQ